MRTLRFWLYLTLVAVVSIVTLGRVHLDRPRQPRIRRMHPPHRLFIGLISRWRGRRDGRWYIPGEADERKPAEIVRLKQQADSLLRRIAADWARGDARLESERQAIERKCEDSRYEIDAHRKPDLEQATARAAACFERLEKVHRDEEERGADERWRIGTFVYSLGLIAIFFGEFPLNGIAFQLFGEGTLQTWIMTAGLAAVLVFCAHGLGVLMRLNVLPFKEEAIAWALAIVPVVVIVAIGVIRVAYLENLGGTADILANLGAIPGTIIFGVINIVIYLGAFVLSYLHHDPITHGIEKNERALKQAEREVRRRKRSLDREEHRLTWLKGRIDLWEGARKGALQHATYKAWRHKDFFEAFMQSYGSANRVAIERRMRKEQRRALRAERRAKRRGETFISPALRLSSHSKALEEWPEIVIPDPFVRRASRSTPKNGRGDVNAALQQQVRRTKTPA